MDADEGQMEKTRLLETSGQKQQLWRKVSNRRSRPSEGQASAKAKGSSGSSGAGSGAFLGMCCECGSFA